MAVPMPLSCALEAKWERDAPHCKEHDGKTGLLTLWGAPGARGAPRVDSGGDEGALGGPVGPRSRARLSKAAHAQVDIQTWYIRNTRIQGKGSSPNFGNVLVSSSGKISSWWRVLNRVFTKPLHLVSCRLHEAEPRLTVTTGAPSGACPTDPREPHDGGAWKRGALLQIKGRGRRGPQGAFKRLHRKTDSSNSPGGFLKV